MRLCDGARGCNNPECGWADNQCGDGALLHWVDDPVVAYVKRIVGMPGETVQMTGGRLVVNGIPIPRESIEKFEIVDRFGNAVSASRRRLISSPGPELSSGPVIARGY